MYADGRDGDGSGLLLVKYSSETTTRRSEISCEKADVLLWSLFFSASLYKSAKDSIQKFSHLLKIISLLSALARLVVSCFSDFWKTS